MCQTGYKRIIACVIILVICISTVGCFQKRYYRASGKIAQKRIQETAQILGVLSESEILRNQENQQLVNDLKLSMDKMTSAETDIEGVEYSFIQGETQDSVIEKVGMPINKQQLDNRTEIWKYDFCDIHFKRGKLVHVEFH